MPTVVVAGSDNSFTFAVIDFTNPASPTVVAVNPMFGAGCRVTLDTDRCFVGSSLTGAVREVDVTNPAAPALQGTINTMLSGIGAIAAMGNLVAVGEWVNTFQARVALLDFSNRAAPTLVARVPTPLTSLPSPDPTKPNPAAITSIAFIGPNTVVAAGSSDPEIMKIDFTNPASPVVSSFLPGFSAVSLDADTSRIVAGDQTGGQVKLFNAATNALLAGPVQTTFGGVTSIALGFPLALVGSVNDLRADRLTFAGATGTNSIFTPAPGGGFTTAIEGTLGACGEISGSSVVLVNLAVSPPVALGIANVVFGSVGTLSIKTFGGAPMTPVASVVPTSHAFGAIRVGTTSAPFSIAVTNTGGGMLRISALSAPARFALTAGGPLPISLGAGVSATLSATFSPNAEQAFSGTATVTTNDPAHTTISIPVSGTGGLPHITVTPAGSIDLGSVAVCQSGQRAVTISNSGAIPLAVSAITTAGAGFSVTPASVVVPASGTATATVRFTPGAVGPAVGSLSITSDDPAIPVVTRALSGIGLPTPPPMIAVSPNPLDLGAAAVNFFVGRRLTIANTGPCQALHVTLTPSGAPFFIATGSPTSVPPASTPIVATIAPNSTAVFAVIFAPTALGVAAGTVDVTSDAGNAPLISVPVSGVGVNLAPASIELVLDRSGSMASPAPGGTKMGALKAAVHLFADLVPTGQGESMGSVEFDDAFAVLTPFGAYDSAQRGTIEAGADSLSPRNFTSIGGGMQLGLTELAGAAARKVMIVFTDGMENTPPTIATVQPTLVAAGVESYAVGLGQPQNISTAALSTLASSSGGRFFQTDDTLILRKDFVEVLVDAFRQNMAADPILTLSAGQVLDVPVLITDCERRISFVANWDDPASVIELEIVSPGGTVYSPTSSNSNQLVRYGEHPGYRFYQIAFPPLDPGSGLAIGPTRIGSWTMRLRGTSLAAATERLTTSVFVEGELELRVIVEAPDANSPLDVRAFLFDDGKPLTDARVVLTVASPTRSLSQVSTPAVIARALNADRVPIGSTQRRLIPTRTRRYKLRFDEKGYRATLPPPRLDGVYQFTVEAMGKACGGIFQRYNSQSVYLGRTCDPDKSDITVTQGGRGTIVVRVLPRDAVGVPLGAGVISSLAASTVGGIVRGWTTSADGSVWITVSPKSAARKRELRLEVAGTRLRVPLPRAYAERKKSALETQPRAKHP